MLRLGAPPELIAEPFALAASDDILRGEVQLLRERSPRLTALLIERDLDAALISSIDFALFSDRLDLIPGLALISSGRTGIAWLDHTGSLERIDTLLARDPEHQAVVLARLLLASSGRRTVVRQIEDSDDPPLSREVGRIRHGDEAWSRSPSSGTVSVDLSEAWSTLTGTPFCWYFWVAAPGQVGRLDYRRLHSWQRRVRTISPRIVANIHGIDTVQSQTVTTLLQGIRHRLGREQLDAAHRFWSRSVQHGFLPRTATPRFASFGAS